MWCLKNVLVLRVLCWRHCAGCCVDYDLQESKRGPTSFNAYFQQGETLQATEAYPSHLESLYTGQRNCSQGIESSLSEADIC